MLLLGVNGLVVGILNSYDHFAIPAISPLVWNVVIIGVLVATHGMFEGDEQLYAYALGIVGGTVVQLLMVLPVLRRLGLPLRPRGQPARPAAEAGAAAHAAGDRRPRAHQLRSGHRLDHRLAVSESAPRAIDAAFRLYMLPQGMFSVAVATVLFPALSRFAAAATSTGCARCSPPACAGCSCC